MRVISNNILTLLATNTVDVFTLVKFEFGTPILHTTASINIAISGLGTFSTDCGLKAIDPPKLSKVVDRDSYKLTYVDPSFSFRSLLESGAIGVKMNIYFGFFNTLNTTLGGAAPGQPLLDIGDTILVYRGGIDSHGYTISDDGEVALVIEGSSPMAGLSISKPFYTSQDTIKQLGLVDNSFDQVYEGSGALNLLWGKY